MLAISYRLYRSLFTSRQAKASRARLSKKKLIPPRLVRWLVDEVNAEASVNYARDFVTNLTNWIGQRIIASLAVLLFFSFFFFTTQGSRWSDFSYNCTGLDRKLSRISKYTDSHFNCRAFFETNTVSLARY